MLPTGTVTFLFTDIEGSTRLWEQHPEAMRDALARHDAILRQAIREHNGAIFKNVGDGLCAVFAAAWDAVAAALEGQRRLRAGEWGDLPGCLPVRMALHTGTPEQREGDYVGPALNRVARLLDAGHGGQILVSHSTFALAGDTLPSQSALRDLGEHRLRDLERTERIFQLDHPDLPVEFPPLRSLGGLPNNLPRRITSFFGREREIADVQRLLSPENPDCQLLTLTGPGGCGKTRLALEAGAALLAEFTNGVWWVDLAGLADPTLVPHAIASVLRVREDAARPLLATMSERLQDRQLLLILDNCEHVLAATDSGGGCAEAADVLVQACPGVRILATSREALGVAGEATYRVTPLSVPGGERLPEVEDLDRCDSVRLLVARARLRQPEFAVTRRNARAVAQVCDRLDGIPLAIELAAARLGGLSVEQLATRLDDRFHLLTGGSRTAPPRHQTLRAAIDWSFDLLSSGERTLLRRLSVFAGGWELEMAEQVCAGEEVEAADILDLLLRLVEKSLVIADPGSEGQTRYRLLETIRGYGQERLKDSAEAETLRTRHMEGFLALAEEAEQEMFGGLRQRWWLDRLAGEQDNLRFALDWALTWSPPLGLRMVAALWRFWYARNHFAEGRRWLDAMLQKSDQAGPDGIDARARAKASSGAGTIAWCQGENQRAKEYHVEALALYRQAGDQPGVAFALHNLGVQEYERGRLEEARVLFAEAASVARQAGDPWTMAVTLHGHGELARDLGDWDEAAALLEEGQQLYRRVGDQFNTALLLEGLGTLAIRRGEHEGAGRLLRESLRISEELEDRRNMVECLESLAVLSVARREFEQAGRLLGAAEAVREALDTPVPGYRQQSHLETVNAVRSALSVAAFDAVWTAGREMTLSEAVEFALQEGSDG